MSNLYLISELLCIGAAAVVFTFVAAANLRFWVRLSFIPVFLGALLTAGILHETETYWILDACAGLVWMTCAVVWIAVAKHLQGTVVRSSDPKMKRSHAVVHVQH